MNKSASKNNRQAGFEAMAKGSKKANNATPYGGGKVNTQVKGATSTVRRQGQRGQ